MDHGPVIQMQRDLRWFKFVEKSVSPGCRDLTNNEGLTPWMLFRKEHMELRSRAQNWIVETATSFIRVGGAIAIAASVFSNVIAYAGGNKLDDTAFQIFAICYTMSVLTSMCSMAMYIDIVIISHFKEEEFLYSLPNKVIIGILSIFVAVVYLMAAFFTGMYIVFAQKIAVLLTLVLTLVTFPISSFVLLQFPVLVDLIYNTYFSGKAGKQH